MCSGRLFWLNNNRTLPFSAFHDVDTVKMMNTPCFPRPQISGGSVGIRSWNLSGCIDVSIYIQCPTAKEVVISWLFEYIYTHNCYSHGPQL